MIRRICGVVVVIVVAACGPANQKARVTIRYQQVAQFSEYYRSPDANDLHSVPGGIYILYRIRNIDNTGAEAKPFVFQSHGLLLASGGEITNEESGDDKKLLENQFSSPLSVQAGQLLVKPKGLGCVIKVAYAADVKSLYGKMIDPIYQIDSTQPVELEREPGNTTEATVFNTLPSALQSLCNTQ